MKKIKVSHDLKIPGWGVVKAGTAFKVSKFNKRFVYVELQSGAVLRLSRKSDCEIVY